QEDDAERFNSKIRRPGEPEEKPLYVPEDVNQTLPLMVTENYNEPKTIAEGIDIEFFEAGHILGSASVRMTVRDGNRTVRIIFSGDVGVTGSPILNDPITPDGTTAADVVLLESTYGDRDHKSLESTKAEFLAVLQQAQ